MSYGTSKEKLREYNELTRDSILERVSQIEIFERVFNVEVQFNRHLKSPIRVDENAGCFFHVSEEGRVKFVDKARDISEDCFGLIMLHFGKNFNETLYYIAGVFNLFGRDGNLILSPLRANDSSKVYLVKKKKLTVSRTRSPWSKESIDFWKDAGFTGELIKEMFIYVVDHVFLNNRMIYSRKYGDPAFVYYFPDNTMKIYFPKRKKGKKFLTDSMYLQGYNLLPKKGKKLLITKSYKDVGVARLLGVPSVAPQSENDWMTEEIWLDLLDRFDEIYLLYDNDKTGIEYSNKRVEEHPEIIPIFLSEDSGKDLYEVAVTYSIQEAGEELYELMEIN